MAIMRYSLEDLPSHVKVFYKGRLEGVIPYEDLLRLQELKETNPHGKNISITDRVQYSGLAHMGLVKEIIFQPPHSGFLVVPTEKAIQSKYSPVRREGTSELEKGR